MTIGHLSSDQSHTLVVVRGSWMKLSDFDELSRVAVSEQQRIYLMDRFWTKSE
jgi:hypothetical protein